MNERVRPDHRWLIAVPLAAVLVAYFPAPWGALVWDDHNFYREMPLFTTLRHLFEPPEGFFTPLLYFRPVYYLSYLVDHRIWGAESIAGPHVTNLVLHVGVVALVYFLLRRLLVGRPGGRVAAALGATLFAVHPIHSENVNWIAGRADIIAAFWLAAAMLLFVSARDRRSPVRFATAAALMFAGLLSKEVAFAGLAIGPAIVLLAPRADFGAGGTQHADRRPGDWWWAASVAALAVVLAAGYLRLRAEFGAGLDTGPLNLDAPRLLLTLQVAGWYLLRLVYPGAPALVVAPNMLPGIGLALSLLALALALAGWALWRWRKTGDGVPLLGVWWTAVTLAPALTIPLTDLTPAYVASLVAERYLYVPSIGLAVVAGAALTLPQPDTWRRVALGAGAAVALLAVALSLQRSVMWRSEVCVWEALVAQQPEDGLPWFQLGRAQLRADDIAGAEASYLKGLSLPSTPFNRATAYYNLGNFALRRGDIATAENHYRASAWEMPTFGLAYYGLGDAYHQSGLRLQDPGERLQWFDRSRAAYDRAVQSGPGAAELRLQIVRLLADRGAVLAALGRLPEATGEYSLAAQLLGGLAAAVPQLAADPAVVELRARLDAGLRTTAP